MTIVLLIILATISLNSIFGENGLIKRTEASKELHERQEQKEKLELIKTDMLIDSNGKVTVNQYIEELIRQGITTTDEVRPNDDGSKTIVTEDGYSVIISTDPSTGTPTISVEGKANKLPPRITNIKLVTSTGSIKVDVEAKRANGATYSYYYKTEGGEYQKAPVYESKNTSYTIEGLMQDVNYTVKVVVSNSFGAVYAEEIGRTSNVPAAVGSLTISDLEWNNGKASITVRKKEESTLTIRYKIGTGEEKTVEDGGTIGNLEINDIVTIRLWDGTNGGGTATVNVKELEAPTVTIGTGTITLDSIEVNVVATDDKSGMPENPTYHYYIKKSSELNYPATPISLNSAKYYFEGLDYNTSYDIKVTTEDRAKNVGEAEITGIYTVDAVAKINTTFYPTIQSAVNSVPTNNTKTTIILLKDATESVTVEANKNIEVDLDNHTMTNSGTVTIVNNGRLKIGNGTVKSTVSHSISNREGATAIVGENANIESASEQYATIYNYGNLQVTAGSVRGIGSKNPAIVTQTNAVTQITGGSVNSVNSNTISNQVGGTTEISGTAKIEGAMVNYNTISNSGTLNIHGGEITAPNFNAIYNYENATVNISGGKLTSGGGSVINNRAGGKVEITDTATLDGTSTYAAIYNLGNFDIKGGNLTASAASTMNNQASGIVSISGTAKITGTSPKNHAIISNYGTLKASGGEIIAGSYNAIYNQVGSKAEISDTAKIEGSLKNQSTINNYGDINMIGGVITAPNSHAISNYQNATITASGGTITSNKGNAINNRAGGVVEISGIAKIEGNDTNGNAAISNFSTVNITGGEITSVKNFAIYNQSGANATINGGSLIANDFTVLNAANGEVVMNKGTLQSLNGAAIYNYAEGSIKLGKEAKVEGSSEYQIISNYGNLGIDGSTITSKKGYAIYNYSSGTTTVNGEAKIVAERGFTVRNEGKFSSTGGIITGGAQAIQNIGSGILDISGTAKIDAVATDAGATIYNTGTVNMTAGTITGTNAYGISNSEGGSATISGGSIVTTGENAINNFGTINIAGTAIIKATDWNTIYNGGTLIIRGGTIVKTSASPGTTAEFGTIFNAKILTIEGGTVINEVNGGYGVYNSGGTVTHTGGTIGKTNF